MTEHAPFPPLAVYALAHRCPVCHAHPGEPCNAPNKNKRLARVDRIRAELGMDQVEHDDTSRMHAPRVDAGIRHRHRDIAAAPWPEDREPGRSYATLPRNTAA